MRKNRFIQWGIILFILGLVLVVLYVRQEHSNKQADEEKTAIRDVVMARQYIPNHTLITPGMVYIQSVDTRAAQMPNDAQTSLDAVTDKFTTTAIFPRQPISATQLIARDQLGLAGQLPPGERAITIPVDETTAVAGFIRPGDRVDALGTFREGREGKPVKTETLLQNVQVVAVGKNTTTQANQKAEGGNLITLAVTPKEAARLTFAQSSASIQLVLRSISDTQDATTAAVVIKQNPVTAKPRIIHRRLPSAPVHRVEPRRSFPLETVSLPPAAPELPYPPALPAQTPPLAKRESGAGPAPKPAANAQAHTVDVIRGTTRESVTLRTVEGKVMQNESALGPR